MHKPATKSKARSQRSEGSGLKSDPASFRKAGTTAGGGRVPVRLSAVLLALGTLALYWPALHHDFVNYDDQVYVTSDVRVQAGLTLANLRWAFFEPDSHFGYWHPLTLLSHMLDCQMYGLKPWGHHLTSVLLHALNTVLVFVLLFRLTGARWRSVMVAALFAVHPLHVESVAWVAERKDVLSTCFGLLTLYAYGRYAAGRNIEHRTSNTEHRIKDGTRGMLRTWLSALQARSGFYYALALVFFALGLMCKPMLVTVPFVMLLLDWWPLGRSQRSEVGGQKADTAPPSTINHQLSTLWPLVLEKIPFFCMAGVMSGVTFLISKKGGILTSGQAMSLDARLENAVISYGRYLGKLFWPARLAVFYPHPGHWPLLAVAATGAGLICVFALFWGLRRRYPFLLMGWLWFVGTLVPVIGLVQVGEHAMADRYAYIPSLGVFIAVVWGTCELTAKWPYRKMAVAVAGAGAIGICVWLTRQQLGYWQDDESLFRHALAVTRDNYIAHKGLGDALDEKGDLAGAMTEFQAALQLRPGFAEAHGGLGNVLLEKGRVDEAIGQYQEALRLRPDDFEARCNLGNAWLNQGRTDEAIGEFRQAIGLKPDVADAHYDLGVALGGKGEFAEAIDEFRQAIQLDPGHAPAYNNLGTALFRTGRVDEAIGDYRQALRLKPDFDSARENLARAVAAAKNGGVNR